MEVGEVEIRVTDANFKQEVLESELPCLVDFWAPWCGPCHVVAPIIEQIAQEYQGKLKVCKVNVDEAPQVASQYEIMAIPTLTFFKGGEVVDKVMGAMPKEALEVKIKPIIE